jgi:hypothetical protein
VLIRQQLKKKQPSRATEDTNKATIEKREAIDANMKE